ncbi:MAG: HNH endonuclease signature motif containing protein [Pseudonocardiaceae bacterium]
MPSWCEVHHILQWQYGGRTDLENLLMLCWVHHRLLHDSVWSIRIRNGRPEFIPPTWIDPTQTPR